MRKFSEEKYTDLAEKTLDYVEISKVNKINNNQLACRTNVPNNSETKRPSKSYPQLRTL